MIVAFYKDTLGVIMWLSAAGGGSTTPTWSMSLKTSGDFK